MKKFLLFTLEFPPTIGGVAKYYDNLVRYWGDDNIFVLANKHDKKSVDINNIFYRKLTSRYLWPSWLGAIYYLYQLVVKQKIDHVIVGQVLPLGTVAYFLSRFLKFEYSVILHGMDFSLAIASGRKRKLTAKILLNSVHIICGNNFTKNLVLEFDPQLGSRLEVVNPGAEIDVAVNLDKLNKLRDKYGLQNRKVIFSIGRLVKRKGFDKVIEAMPLVLKKDKDIVYVLAGAGPEKKYLQDKISSLPEEIGKKIFMLGEVSDEEYCLWLKLCDIFAMPSRNIAGDFEGFGIVFLEANLFGKPVIAGDSGGVRDAVQDELNGLLVDPENTEEIAAAIIRLAQNEELRVQLGEQGRIRALRDFTWKKQIAKIYRILLK